MTFLNRSKRARGARLGWRVRVFWAGALAALAGIYLELSWLIWIAIALLLVGVLLRFLPRETEDADGREKGYRNEEEGSFPP